MRNLMSNEFCIMPDNPPYWRNFRYCKSERHEVFEGNGGNRKKSIEDGLVVFTTQEFHRTGKLSIHLNPKGWEELTKMKQIAEKRWCEYYGKTKEDFRERYHKNYL